MTIMYDVLMATRHHTKTADRNVTGVVSNSIELLNGSPPPKGS